jgi:prephenate dehydrogenase
MANLNSLLVIGASGGIGNAFCRKVAPAYQVIALDRDGDSIEPADQVLQADVTDRQSLAVLDEVSFDAIVVALPTALAEAVVENVIEPYGDGKLVVDFFSEKKAFHDRVRRATVEVAHVGIHPMFAPSLDWTNQNVLLTPSRVADPRAQALFDHVKTWGANTIHLEPEEHDQLLGVIQSAVHASVIAYATVLSQSDVDFQFLDEISTPASRVMWAMVARMIDNDPAVYWEIQSLNAHSAEFRTRLSDALESLDDMVRDDDERSFLDLFETVGEKMGDKQQKYIDLARDLYAHEVERRDEPSETRQAPLSS